MYGQLVVKPEVEFAALTEKFECAKITDMSSIDLNRFRFDFDLTLSVLLMRADGTVYHRYGGRGKDDPLGRMSVSSLRRVMERTLVEHREVVADVDAGRKGEVPEARTVFDLPIAKRYFRNGRPECVHCHTVHEVEQAQRVSDEAWQKDDLWIYPAPERVGLVMDVERQDLVGGVLVGSPAAMAGVRVGDRVVSIGVQRSVATIADVQWALHNAAFGAGRIPMRIRRVGRGDAEGEVAELDVELGVSAGWKRSSTEEYAWRPFKWGLSPAPGFGGPVLDAAEKKRLGIEARFAFRVGYLVTWGRRAHRGRAAARAGIRKGDVVVSFAGRDDFEGMDHFHAFVRLECRVGQEVEVVRIRDGRRAVVRYRLPE